MRRREFTTLLSGVVVGWPLAARAERPFVVGMIGNSLNWPHFRDAMRDLGYREGQNVKYELRTDETEPAVFSSRLRTRGRRVKRCNGKNAYPIYSDRFLRRDR